MEEAILGLPQELVEGGIIVVFSVWVFAMLFRYLTGNSKSQDGHFTAVIEVLTSLINRFTNALDKMTDTMIELKNFMAASRDDYRVRVEQLEQNFKEETEVINIKLDEILNFVRRNS